jgi:hypothetical protein
LAIFYGNKTAKGSEALNGLNATFLHIGNLSLPARPSWHFCVSGTSHEHCFAPLAQQVTSAIVSLPSHGEYRVLAVSDESMILFQDFNVTSDLFSVDVGDFVFPITATLAEAPVEAPTSIFTDPIQGSLVHCRKAIILDLGWLMTWEVF